MTLLTYTDLGDGDVTLLLHGGAGPQSVAPFAPRLGGRVLTPTHPGFAGTARPPELTSVRALAAGYADLLDELDLREVLVVGSSVGGWVAAELALLRPDRVGRLVLVDAVGIEVPDHPVADFFALSLPELAELSYHQPDAFRIDPSTMSDAQRAAMAGNRAALAVYAASMTDPTLLGRLAGIVVPTLVVWGESDRIVDADYGRAYADAIPGARFELLRATGHMPQLETPQALAEAIARFR